MQKITRNTCLIIVSLALISLSACGSDTKTTTSSPDGAGTQVSSAESLLSAEGGWNIVEQKKEVNPLAAHLDAKSGVNPAKMSANPDLIASAEKTDKPETVHYRLLKMEREVSGLRSDFNKLLPPLSNLIVSDRALDSTVSEIMEDQTAFNSAPPPSEPPTVPAAEPVELLVQDKLQSTEPRSASPKEPVPAVKPILPEPVRTAVTTKEAVKPAPISAGAPRVTKLRLGEHPEKTRLVLEITAKTSFTADVDNSEKIIVVELPALSWDATQSQTFSSNPLIAGYKAQPSGKGGTTLVLEMKKPVKITSKASLEPTSNPPLGHRIYMDIAAE